MADTENTTETKTEEKAEETKPRRRSSRKSGPAVGDKVRVTGRRSTVHLRAGQVREVEATDILLGLADKGYVDLEVI